MVKAVCRDYGFDCDFTCEGDLDTVTDGFGKHCTEEIISINDGARKMMNIVDFYD